MPVVKNVAINTYSGPRICRALPDLWGATAGGGGALSAGYLAEQCGAIDEAVRWSRMARFWKQFRDIAGQRSTCGYQRQWAFLRPQRRERGQ